MVKAKTLIFLIVVVMWPLASVSDEPPPFAEFTFKRIKVPAPGGQNLINIQIDPTARIARITVADVPKPDPPAPGSGTAAWFWDQISPKLTDSEPGRLAAAVRILRDLGPDNGLATPRLGTMQALVDLYGRDILLASVGTRVSPALVLAVMGVESGGRADAVSSAGAVGLMQLIPATAARFGVEDPTDAVDNIRGGVAYLDWLMDAFDSDPIMVLAAYNAGENAVRKHGGVPEFAETRAYVPKVLAAWTVARALCLTPPELASDGCVFSIQKVVSE